MIHYYIREMKNATKIYAESNISLGICTSVQKAELNKFISYISFNELGS